MVSSAAHERTMQDMALLREACDIDPQILGARFSAAGIDDFPQDGFLVLAAAAIQGAPEGRVMRELGITEEAGRQAFDTLVQRGYVEVRPNPDDHGPAGTFIAQRGIAVLTMALSGIMTARWADFPFRQGDIVISTLPKSGTTWMQMICAALIFQSPDLPEPMRDLSPWMDATAVRRDALYAKLAAQKHRRFIKTHMPLNELPMDLRATHIVVARHPLDVAVSMYYQDHRDAGRFEVDPPHEWLLQWIDVDPARAHRNSLPGALRSLSYVWARRSEPHVVLVHYDDLLADLEGEMRRLAARLGITVPETIWPRLVKAATFEQMRAAADRLTSGVVDAENPAAFFRRGKSGSGRELLTRAELANYHAHAAEFAPPDLLAWLHRDEEPDGAATTPDSGSVRKLGPPASLPGPWAIRHRMATVDRPRRASCHRTEREDDRHDEAAAG
jgi:hypothetical protein